MPKLEIYEHIKPLLRKKKWLNMILNNTVVGSLKSLFLMNSHLERLKNRLNVLLSIKKVSNKGILLSRFVHVNIGWHSQTVRKNTQ